MPDQITILHLSDLQFGRNHRFGRLAEGDPDATFHTLLTRLTDDLASLRDGEFKLRPELLIVSGDLAEWGRPKEFEDTVNFLDALIRFLGLGHERVVIVPGNHDINRKLCEAYFNECEGHGAQPLEPYFRKWEPFVAMFERFYKDIPGVTFSPDQPWTLFEFPDFKLVAAALNSTMRDSHLDEIHGQKSHVGWVGEGQCRWFADRLTEYERRGWFRLSVLHHNIIRGNSKDDESLFDANTLTRYLGESLNLLLHGHTHEAKLGWLHPKLPIVSTGSAGLIAAARPEEVPNQYQILRLSGNGLERWTRCYSPTQKQWLGDNRSSRHGDSWHTVQPIEFTAVSGTFPEPNRDAKRRRTRNVMAGSQETAARKHPQHQPLLLDLERAITEGELRDSELGRLVLETIQTETGLELAADYRSTLLLKAIRIADAQFSRIRLSAGHRDWQRDFAQASAFAIAGIAKSLHRSADAQAVVVRICEAVARQLRLELKWPDDLDEANELKNAIYNACLHCPKLDADEVLVELQRLTIVGPG